MGDHTRVIPPEMTAIYPRSRYVLSPIPNPAIIDRTNKSFEAHDAPDIP